MLSFTMQSPDNNIQSQGTWFKEGSENSNTSPGTRSWEETERPAIKYVSINPITNSQQEPLEGVIQKPFLRTRTSHSNSEISRNRRMVYPGISLWMWMSIRFGAHRSCLQDGSPNAEYGNEKNANGIVIVLIH